MKCFPGDVIKNPPANAGDAGDVDLIPGSGRSLGVTHSNILAWRIPWTEERGGLQVMGSQRVRHHWARAHMDFREITINEKVPHFWKKKKGKFYTWNFGRSIYSSYFKYSPLANHNLCTSFPYSVQLLFLLQQDEVVSLTGIFDTNRWRQVLGSAFFSFCK